MYAFELTRAKTVADAAAALAKSGGRALAGGQSLIGAMKLRLSQPGTLVDLSGIAELKGIRKEGDAIVIGAMTRHAEVAVSPTVKGAIPALAALAQGIGDRQVRNMGTLGGSIAHNDPAADWPAAVLGLGATVHTNKRKIAADDFFKGMYETALAGDELITAVSFPMPKKAGYAKFPNPASRFALIGVFVAQTGSGVRVAVTGAAPAVFRSKPLEDALGKSFTMEAARGSEDRREGPEQRPARLARVPRAPGRGDGGARGRRRRLSRQVLLCCRVAPAGCRPIFSPDDCRASRFRRRRSRAARPPRLRRRPAARDQRLPRAPDGPPAVPRRRGRRRQDRDREGARRGRSAGSSSGSSATKGSTSPRRSTNGTTRGR